MLQDAWPELLEACRNPSMQKLPPARTDADDSREKKRSGDQV
jgi:hypothetical protein